MVNTFPFNVLVGTVLGFLSGLGTGGGSLLILWLTLVMGMDAGPARLINLMFFLPSAIVATFFNHRRCRLPIRKLLSPIVAGCIAAALASVLAKNMDTEQLKKLFGILLIFTGIRELTYRARKPR